MGICLHKIVQEKNQARSIQQTVFYFWWKMEEGINSYQPNSLGTAEWSDAATNSPVTHKKFFKKKIAATRFRKSNMLQTLREMTQIILPERKRRGRSRLDQHWNDFDQESNKQRVTKRKNAKTRIFKTIQTWTKETVSEWALLWWNPDRECLRERREWRQSSSDTQAEYWCLFRRKQEKRPKKRQKILDY